MTSRGTTKVGRRHRGTTALALLIGALVAVAGAGSASASMIGFEQLILDFTSGKKLQASWSKPTILTRTKLGLGWDGPSNASHSVGS